MFCRKCGEEINVEHAFCPVCGSSLKPVQEQATASSAKKGSGGRAKAVVGILAVLIGCAAGFFAFSLLKGGSGSINPPPVASEDSQLYDQEVLRSLVLNYTKAWAEAVNKNDFSLVEKYLLPGSSLFDAQKELLGRLQKDKVRLQLVKADIGELSPGSDPGAAIIHDLEEYNVLTGGSREVSRCYWTYAASYLPGQGWKLSWIEEDATHRTDANLPVVVMREYKQDRVALQYPQVENLASAAVQDKINAVLQKPVDRFLTGKEAESWKQYPNNSRYEAQTSYTVAWQTTDTLSIVYRTYTYTGGAHGSSSEVGYNFDLKTGDLITLRDKVGDEKIRSYNDQILQQIRAKNIPIFEPFKGIGDKTAYYLADNHTLVVVFQQYEIAPYSSGILRFELPY